MSWPRLVIQGRAYDFGHLAPFTLKIVHADASELGVRVAFGCHTFTRILENGDDPDFHFQDGSTTRCFCLHRHANSRFLPGIIKDASTKSVFIGDKGKFYVVRRLPALVDPYAVYFTVRKGGSHTDAKLQVVSAYDKGDLPVSPKALPFAEVIGRIVAGERGRDIKK